MKSLILASLVTCVSVVFTRPVRAQCELGQIVAADLAPMDAFGDGMALLDDTLFVGASSQGLGGSAYVFQRSASGWLEVQKLEPWAASSHGLFGLSISVWGDWAWIGAPDMQGASSASGAVYVYARTATGWEPSDKLFPSTGDNQNNFGWSVAVHEDTAIVGLRDYLTNAAHVYERWGSAWLQTAVLTPSDDPAQSRFGSSVAVRGDRAFVGAPEEDGFEGAVYVYERGPAGWTETAKITEVASLARSHFGHALAFDGERLAVGAHGNNNPCTGWAAGAVMLFTESAAGWVLEQEVRPSDADECGFDEFGASLSLVGDRLLVGANIQSFIGAGTEAAYAFERIEGTWTQIAKFETTGSPIYNDYGSDVLLDGDVALVSEPGDGGLGAPPGRIFQYSIPAFAVPYCYCTAGAACGNPDGIGGCANSTGDGARLTACGTGGVSADDLVLTVAQLPANQPGVLFMGDAARRSVFGDGELCVAAGSLGVFRYPIQGSGGAGVLEEGPGIVAFSQSSFGAAGAIAAGQTWNFQGWYRDPLGPCGGGTNLSNALAVSFTP